MSWLMRAQQRRSKSGCVEQAAPRAAFWPVTSYMTFCGLSEGGKLWAVVSFFFSGGATVFPAWYPHHVLQKWPTFLLLLIPAQLRREKHLFQQPEHPNQLVYSAGRTNMHLWSPPSIFWNKEPALGSPRNQMKMIQDLDFHGGCAWSWRKMVSCSQQCCCPPDVNALQICAHQNVGWGLPITSAFSASSLPSVFGVVWVCL